MTPIFRRLTDGLFTEAGPLIRLPGSSGATPELQLEHDRLKLLLDMTNTLVSNLDLRDLLRVVAASIRKEKHCDGVGCGCRIWSRANYAWRVQISPSKGFSKEDYWPLPIEGSAVGRAFKTGKSVLLNVTSEHSCGGSRVPKASSLSALCLSSAETGRSVFWHSAAASRTHWVPER